MKFVWQNAKVGDTVDTSDNDGHNFFHSIISKIIMTYWSVLFPFFVLWISYTLLLALEMVVSSSWHTVLMLTSSIMRRHQQVQRMTEIVNKTILRYSNEIWGPQIWRIPVNSNFTYCDFYAIYWNPIAMCNVRWITFRWFLHYHHVPADDWYD